MGIDFNIEVYEVSSFEDDGRGHGGENTYPWSTDILNGMYTKDGRVNFWNRVVDVTLGNCGELRSGLLNNDLVEKDGEYFPSYGSAVLTASQVIKMLDTAKDERGSEYYTWVILRSVIAQMKAIRSVDQTFGAHFVLNWG